MKKQRWGAGITIGAIVLGATAPSAVALDVPANLILPMVATVQPTDPPEAVEPTPQPTTAPRPPPIEPSPPPQRAPAPPPEQPAPVPPGPEPGPQIDPATGFAVDPTTGWLIHPGTGYVIEPGTGNLVYPDNYYYTGFRYEFATGLVVDLNAATPSPTPSPTPTQTSTPSPTPTPSATPSATAGSSQTPSASPTATETPAALEADKAGQSSESWSTHPATRIAVILGLLALGALYYTKLRGGSGTGKKPE